MCLPLKTFRDFPQSILQGQVPTPLGSATLGRPIFRSSSLTSSCPMGFGFFFKHRIYCIKPYLGPQSTSAVRAERGSHCHSFFLTLKAASQAVRGPGAQVRPTPPGALSSAWTRLPHAFSTPSVPPETPFSLLPSHQSLYAKKFLVQTIMY